MNNYKEFKYYLNQQDLNNKKKLLIHSCCAVCSLHVIDLLNTYFNITIYFINDNIHPSDEYQKRLDTLKKFLRQSNKEIKLIEEDYDPKKYYTAVEGYETLGERSHRCYKCYEYRLRFTALKAKELNFDLFTTTLSISPHKNSNWVNELGIMLQKEHGIKFLYSDFKKEEGYFKSKLIAKEFNLYSQNYCGCLYSLEDSFTRRNNDANKDQED